MTEDLGNDVESGASDNVEPVNGGAPEPNKAPEPPPYTPNLKYKVLDEERELPEWLAPSIKSETEEKTLREIFEMAGGLPHIKTRRDQLEQENRGMRDAFYPIYQKSQEMQDALGKRDYDSLFSKMGISDQDLYNYVYNRIELQQDPDKYRAYTHTKQLESEKRELEQRYLATQQMAQEMAVQRRSWELDMELSKPEISSFMNEFDSRIGAKGAFRDEVIRRGQFYAAQGMDIPVSQAAAEVLRLAGWVPQAPQAPQVAPPQAPQSPPASLPNIRGRGTSPAKAVPKSTEELRKLAAQYRGQ